MTQEPHILLLAGSFEARRVAEGLSSRAVSYTAWLSEAPRGPAALPQTPQLRRFEDSSAMQEEMALSGYSGVLDASHTFDRQVSEQAFAAASALGLPYLRLERPAWDVTGHPRWKTVADVAAATATIPAGVRVFCATGWDSLPAYADFRADILMLRQTRRHSRPAPFSFVELIFGDPPFDQSSEEALFSELKVDVLVCRNLGGLASRPKLDAAAALDLDVILIDRPPAPRGAKTVAQVDDALDWIEQL